MADSVTGGLILNQTDISASTNSLIVSLGHNSLCGYDIKLTNADSAGTLKIQVCNDISQTSPNWVDVAFNDSGSVVTSITVTAGVAVSKFLELETSALFTRLVWTRSAGGAADVLRVSCSAKRG